MEINMDEMKKAFNAFKTIKDYCHHRHGACSGCLFELDMEDAPDSMDRCVFCLGHQPHSWWRLERKLGNPEDVIV